MLRAIGQTSELTKRTMRFVHEQMELVRRLDPKELECPGRIGDSPAADGHDLDVRSPRPSGLTNEVAELLAAMETLHSPKEHEHDVSPLELVQLAHPPCGVGQLQRGR